MLNYITFMGRLTHEIELKTTPNNIDMTRFNVAVDRDFKKDDGTRETDFIDCVAWRQKATFIGKYFHKGDLIVVTGRLQTDKYTDNEGKNRKSVTVVVSDVYFGGSKKDGNYSPNEPSSAPATDPDGFMNIPDNLNDEGLPFN